MADVFVIAWNISPFFMKDDECEKNNCFDVHCNVSYFGQGIIGLMILIRIQLLHMKLINAM